MSYHLAQLNLAPAKGPREDPQMQGFYEAVEMINRLAEDSDGFIWRLKDESGDSTGIRAFPDPTVLVTMSVWRDMDSLRLFVYKSTHVDFLRRRHEWFNRPTGPGMVLWWVPEGHLPTLGEARARLDMLAEQGSNARAFTFGAPFPVPEST